jgi:hypothetical protein
VPPVRSRLSHANPTSALTALTALTALAGQAWWPAACLAVFPGAPAPSRAGRLLLIGGGWLPSGRGRLT